MKDALIPEKKSNSEIFGNMQNEITRSGNTEIVEYYLSTGLIQRCIDFQFKKLCKLDPGKKQFKNDLFQDLCVWLLTYDNAKMNDAHANNHFNALLTRIIQNQIYSASSKFFRQYIDFDKRALWDTAEYINRKEDGEEEN